MHMRKCGWLAAFGLALMSAQAEPARGQIVDVQPGYVEVWPFARVYRGPDGTHVRAPFTDVYVPRRRPLAPGERYLGPEAVPPGSPEDEVGRMDWRALRQVVREESERLDRDLQRVPGGESLQTHLQTAALRELTADDVDEPPPPESRQALDAILANYDALGRAPEHRWIQELPSFRYVHAALVEITWPPLDRHRRQLADASRELDWQLGRFTTAAAWQRHLALPPEVYAEPGDAPLPGRAALEAELDQLERVLSRFDRASQNPRFEVIASLPAFQATHDHLSAYVEQLRADSDAERPGESGAQLPAPAPPGSDNPSPTPSPAPDEPEDR